MKAKKSCLTACIVLLVVAALIGGAVIFMWNRYNSTTEAPESTRPDVSDKSETPEEPTPEAPAPDEYVPEEPTPEVPTPEEPTPEEPTPEEPTPEEPAPEEPEPTPEPVYNEVRLYLPTGNRVVDDLVYFRICPNAFEYKYDFGNGQTLTTYMNGIDLDQVPADAKYVECQAIGGIEGDTKYLDSNVVRQDVVVVYPLIMDAISPYIGDQEIQSLRTGVDENGGSWLELTTTRELKNYQKGYTTLEDATYCYKCSTDGTLKGIVDYINANPSGFTVQERPMKMYDTSTKEVIYDYDKEILDPVNSGDSDIYTDDYLQIMEKIIIPDLQLKNSEFASFFGDNLEGQPNYKINKWQVGYYNDYDYNNLARVVVCATLQNDDGQILTFDIDFVGKNIRVSDGQLYYAVFDKFGQATLTPFKEHDSMFKNGKVVLADFAVRHSSAFGEDKSPYITKAEMLEAALMCRQNRDTGTTRDTFDNSRYRQYSKNYYIQENKE